MLLETLDAGDFDLTGCNIIANSCWIWALEGAAGTGSSESVIRNSVVGPYATVAARAVVECSVIRNSIVNEGARVKEILLDASLVGEDAVVEGSFRRLNVGDSSEVLLI